MLVREAGKLETFKWYWRLDVAYHAAEYFAEQEAELETVTGESGCENNTRVMWEVVKDKVFIGRYIVHARVNLGKFCLLKRW